MVTTIYLVRHGESLGNTEGFFQGRTDCKLSPNGIIQAQALREYFETVNFDVIYSSPLSRTRETANAINSGKSLPLHIDSNIIEIDGGEFEGVSWDDLQALYPAQFDIWRKTPTEFQAPKGESMKQVFERMKKAIVGIALKNIGKTIVVVSHGCAIKNYLCHAMGLDFEQLDTVPWSDNASISKVCLDQKLTPSVDFANFSKHIDLLGLKKPLYWKEFEETK